MKKQTCETMLASAKVWFADVKAEFPEFVMLCKCSMRIVNEKLHGKDVGGLIKRWKSTQKETRNSQMFFGALAAVAALMFALLSSCASEKAESGSDSHGRYDSVDAGVSNSSMCETKAEELALKLHGNPLHAFNVGGKNPVEGCVYRCGSNIIKVIQTVEGGVLADTQAGSIACVIYIKTSRHYADGDYLKEGLYVSTGLYPYIDINGARRTVRAFEEMPDALRNDVEKVLKRINAQRSEKAARDYERQKKMRAEAIAADERYVPSTPEEVVERMFDVDLTGNGPDHRDLEAFYRRIIQSFVWKKFQLDNAAKLEELDDRIKGYRDYMRESVLLFAKWLCDNKWTDAKVGNKGYTSKWLSELKFGLSTIEHNIVIQKSLRAGIEIAYDRKFIEKLSAMQEKKDWEGLIRFAWRDNKDLADSTDLLKSWQCCNEGINRLYNLTIVVALQSKEGKNILYGRADQEKGIDKNFGVGRGVERLPCQINMNFYDKIYVFEWDGYKGKTEQFLENLKKELKVKCRPIPREIEVSMTEDGRVKKEKIIKQNQDNMYKGFIKGFERWLNDN